MPASAAAGSSLWSVFMRCGEILIFFYGDDGAGNFREAFMFPINMQAGYWLLIVEFKTETIYTGH